MMRTLKERDVIFTLEIEMDNTPVRGNALASGDDENDTKVEDSIIEQLNDGNDWAWAVVKVTAHWRSFKGMDTLGGCSYENEEQFKADLYYTDMKQVALDELNNNIKAISADLKILEV